MEGNKWLLIDWAAASNLNLNKGIKREYYGCVTYASDAVLTQLATCHESIHDNECSLYEYEIDCPSELTDLISLFRTMFVFTCRVSNDELDELMNLRANHKFTDIITWWTKHLSPKFKDAETMLIDTFSNKPQDIHEVAVNLAMKLFPVII